MTDEKPKKATEEEARADPKRYKILESGGIYDLQAGRLVGMIEKGSKYAITKETAHAMRQRGKDVAMIAHLRGLAAARGMDLADSDLEQIAEGAASAVEALTKHMAQTFLDSKNLRGMGETFTKLVGPMTGETERDGAPAYTQNNLIVDPELARMIAKIASDVFAYRRGHPEIIDAEATDALKPFGGLVTAQQAAEGE